MHKRIKHNEPIIAQLLDMIPAVLFQIIPYLLKTRNLSEDLNLRISDSKLG